jgi:hypothetical protein
MSDSKQPPRYPDQGPGFEPASDQPHPGVPPQAGPDQYPTAPVPVGQPPIMGEVPTYDRGRPGAGRRNLVLAAVVALVVGLGAGYAVGRQTAPKGPATLAEAIQLAGQGRLPTGNLGAAPGNGGLGGIFRRGAGQGDQGQGQNGQAAPGAGGNGTGNGGNGGQGGFLFGGGQRNGGIQATVTSVSGDTVTLETTAGQLRVRIGSSTTIQKAAKSAKSDVTPGSRVLVSFDLNDSQNDDGSVAAASILAEGKAS